MPRRLVVLESPFAGKGNWWLPRTLSRIANVDYARRALRDSILRGESPIASHLLLTQPGVLRDGDAVERQLGIACGHDWMRVCDAVVVYVDRGISGGMRAGIDVAMARGVRVEYRRMDRWTARR